VSAAGGAAAPDDGVLAARAGRGDSAAFDQLVRRHMRRAVALAHRITGAREDAEDVAQEAFVAALEHLDSYDATRPFTPWFSRIVVRRALNHVKRDERWRRRAVAEAGADIAPGPVASAVVEERELRERVARALDRLPERQRAIVRLTGFDGLTSVEIGALLELPPGTVRYELHQARRRLRDELALCREVES
jgi:RNA polymerase sigma-70 factor, ECF subfamily